MPTLTSNLIEVEDSWEAANDWFLKEKLSDGLPIVPPTPARVERMLSGTKRDPHEVIGPIPPKWAPCSIEKIAINAVMAGCAPDYLPVVIAAVEAICEPRFNLYGVQATTGYVGPALLLNGPIRKQLDVNCDAGVFGPGFPLQCDHRPRDPFDSHHRRRRLSGRYGPFDVRLAGQVHHVLRRKPGKKPVGALSRRVRVSSRNRAP